MNDKPLILERSLAASYERNNVLVGLSCGLRGKAQTGKGMWAMPDRRRAQGNCAVGGDKSGWDIKPP